MSVPAGMSTVETRPRSSLAETKTGSSTSVAGSSFSVSISGVITV